MFKKATLKEYIKVTDPTGKFLQELGFTAEIEMEGTQEIKRMQIHLTGDQLAKEVPGNSTEKSVIWGVIMRYVRENYTIWSKERGVKETSVKFTASEDIINEFGTHIINTL